MLLIIFFLSVGLLPFAVVWGTLLEDSRGLQTCFILLPTAFISGLWFMVISADVRCPLCRGQVLRRPGGNAINHKARKLFGSYRLRVIGGIFFKGAFRCFHCGESCDAIEPRR